MFIIWLIDAISLNKLFNTFTPLNHDYLSTINCDYLSCCFFNKSWDLTLVQKVLNLWSILMRVEVHLYGFSDSFHVIS